MSNKVKPARDKTIPDLSNNSVKFPLALQTSIISLLVSVVMFLLFIFLLNPLIESHLYHQVELRGQSIASQVAESCTQPMVKGDLLFVETSTREIGTAEAVRYAAVITYEEINIKDWEYAGRVTDSGLIIAHSNPEKIGSTFLPLEAFDRSIPYNFKSINSNIGQTEFLFFQHPMVNNNRGRRQVVGTAEVCMQLDDIKNAMRNITTWISIIVAISLSLSLILFLVNSSKNVRTVKSLVAEVSKIGTGESAQHINTRNKSEIGLLVNTYNQTISSLEKVHQDQINRALDQRVNEITSNIHSDLIPGSIPTLPGINLAVNYESNSVPGSDYYDIFRIDKNRWALMIADIAATGLEGSLLMTKARNTLRSFVKTGVSPAEALIRANRLLSPELKDGIFITVSLVYYDMRNKELNFASAGHPPPIVLRNSKTHFLKLPGLPIGADNSGTFEKIMEEGILSFKNDDIILIYSDGLTKITDSNGNLFGDFRLQRILKSNEKNLPADISEQILRKTGEFSENIKPEDDFAYIILKRTS